MDLKHILSYEPETGLIYRTTLCGRPCTPRTIGYTEDSGSISILVNRKKYQATRVAWYLHFGYWPIGSIYHINGVKNDNRLCNLTDTKPTLDKVDLRTTFQYNSETGTLYRIRHYGRPCDPFKVGNMNDAGSLVTSFNGDHYPVARIAWKLHHGEWPREFIHHVNGNKRDNRITNLVEKSARRKYG